MARRAPTAALVVALASFEPGCAPAVEQGERITEPGTYSVVAGDVIPGPMGVDLHVDGVDDTYGYVRGSYVDVTGEVLFSDVFASTKTAIAHYGIEVLHAGAFGQLTLTGDHEAMHRRCLDLAGDAPGAGATCKLVYPTRARDGEVLAVSPGGYFGKTNHLGHAELAACAAATLESVVAHESAFLGLPPLGRGAALLYVAHDDPPLTGVSIGSLAAWFLDGEAEIRDQAERCTAALDSGELPRGDHEVTHLLLRGLPIYGMFNEGLANYAPSVLNKVARPWSTPGSVCQEQGLLLGGTLQPYVQHQAKDAGSAFYYSGECFWVKLSHDHGPDVVPTVMRALAAHAGESGFTFEDGLALAGAEVEDYAAWGLGSP